MRYIYLICLSLAYAFVPVIKPKKIHTIMFKRADDFMNEPDEPHDYDEPEYKPEKIVYRYRGIPPKLCASEQEEQMLERMIRLSNYSEQWTTTMGADWWNYPDESLDEDMDEEILYMSLKKSYNNLTIDDKINIALAQEFLENGDFF
tara:strand:- start:1278 stop:1718 length:441 start_codon:yes stop_codon:yes gene_type:complete